MLVLGVDPGTATTGYGLIREKGGRLEALDYGAVRTSGDLPLPCRLLVIHRELTGLIRVHAPDAIAVEELFFNRNVRTALAVGQARGVVLLTAAAAGVPVAEYTPPQVKQAVTGYGGADKTQMQAMVKLVLGLRQAPHPDDAADALAVAICCVHSRGLERLTGVRVNAPGRVEPLKRVEAVCRAEKTVRWNRGRPSPAKKGGARP